MKILHVASFVGNIGDNASHIGLLQILKKLIPENLEIIPLEIRKFYKNYNLPDKLFFDNQFANLANSCDLVLIGGGGFLDYYIPNSQTGTTIDIGEDVIKKITKPIIFVSVGALPHQEIPEGNKQKFMSFLELLSSRVNSAVFLRNDGSKESIKNNFGTAYAEPLFEILDNGFFYDTPKTSFKITEKPYILINSTPDQILQKNERIGKVDVDKYTVEIRKYIDFLINETTYELVFVPHIFADLAAFNSVLDGVNDFYKRTRISIAPYLHHDEGCNNLFGIYANSEINIGMRFHANVCSLALGKLSIGIAALDRVVNLYNSLGQKNESYVVVDNHFGDELISKFNYNLENREEILKERNLRIDLERKKSLEVYKNVFTKIGII